MVPRSRDGPVFLMHRPNCLVIHYVTNDNYLDPGEVRPFSTILRARDHGYG